MCCPGKVFVKESMLSSIKLHQDYAVFGINSHSNFWDNTVATVYQNKLNIYKNRVLSQLERMQQYLAGFFAHISGPETSILYNVQYNVHICRCICPNCDRLGFLCRGFRLFLEEGWQAVRSKFSRAGIPGTLFQSFPNYFWS